MGVMLVAAKAISDFVNKHPTIKMLALSFLLLVGVVLVADGLGHHVPKGYIYFADGVQLWCRNAEHEDSVTRRSPSLLRS
jgi:predicted tellurium resistance membrane protein TerC